MAKGWRRGWRPPWAVRGAGRVSLRFPVVSQLMRTGTSLADTQSMTLPRMLMAGDFVFVSARTVARTFLFRPDAQTNDALLYLMARHARKHGMRIVAVVLMSNHLHYVLYDPLCRLPRFLRDTHRCFANFIKAHHGWSGAVFDGEPSVQRLPTVESLLDKIAYLLSNPAAAHAVSKSADWPGVRTSIKSIGQGTFTFRRPTKYFSKTGVLPEEASLSFHMPEKLIKAHGSLKAAQEAIAREVSRKERAAASERLKSKQRVLGPVACQLVSPFRRACKREPLLQRNPTFCSKGGGPGLRARLVAELREFRRKYREALALWVTGVRDVVFPPGTWKMVECYGALAAPDG